MTGLADAIKQLTDKAKGDVEMVARQAVFLGAQGLMLKSPVGNPTLWKSPAPKGYVGGRFRANWQFGVGTADTTTTEGTDANGNATLARLKGAIDGAKIGGVWYVTNSLPYAKRLEYGWSKQAPAGFVRLTAQELPDAIRAYVRGAL